jgi:glycosyltransferase involved in cell wall biosynthesis
VVATAVGGVAEYVAPGRGGDLVPRGDATAMAGVIGDWMSSGERRRAAGAFNRQRVVQEFSWRASANRLLEVYRAVLRDREQMKATA